MMLLLYNFKKSVKKKFGNPYMNIQEKFKAIRKQRKLSLRDLANVAGSASSISDFEKGKTNLSNDVWLLKSTRYLNGVLFKMQSS